MEKGRTKSGQKTPFTEAACNEVFLTNLDLLFLAFSATCKENPFKKQGLPKILSREYLVEEQNEAAPKQTVKENQGMRACVLRELS